MSSQTWRRPGRRKAAQRVAKTMQRAIEFAAGLLLVLAILSDVFTSVLVPGPSRGWLRVANWARRLALPVWRHATKLSSTDRRISNLFAPSLFGVAFIAWMLLLLAGFGLMLHAVSSSFAQPIGFLDAVYVAGASILTLGFNEIEPHGLARWVILWAGLSGFWIITASVTFILQVQNSLHQRESAVLGLSGLTGRPGSGIALLENLAGLHMRDELPEFFRRWRDWCASTLHSTLAHPVLAYFRSVDAESDWLFALGIVLDAATIISVLTDDKSAGAATVLHRAGSRTAAQLCELYNLQATDVPPPEGATLVRLAEQLAKAGYSVRSDHDVLQRFIQMRSDYDTRIAALATHLGAEDVPLLPHEGQTRD